MRFFQVPARRWWWGLIALGVYVVCYVIEIFGASFTMVAADPGAISASGELATTPTIFLINNLGIALDIGVCTLLAWLFFRQGFGWLVSVVGRFRWKWLGMALGVFAIGYAVEMIIEVLIYGVDGYGFTDLEMEPYTAFMIVVVLLTTPLQCAGEEFQSRAFLPKVITAIVPFRVPGLVLSALIPSAVFMYLHDAQDPWLNLNYFCVALMMWWITYRTGGIEASIALHFVNNFFSEWMLPFSDFSDMFDRSEGTGSPEVLIYIAVQLVLVLIVDWVARKKGVVRMSAPAAHTPAVVKPRKFVTIITESVVAATKDDLPRIDTTPREEPEPVSMYTMGYPSEYPTEYYQGFYPPPQASMPIPYAPQQMPMGPPPGYGQAPMGPPPGYGQVPPGPPPSYGQGPTSPSPGYGPAPSAPSPSVQQVPPSVPPYSEQVAPMPTPYPPVQAAAPGYDPGAVHPARSAAYDPGSGAQTTPRHAWTGDQDNG